MLQMRTAFVIALPFLLVMAFGTRSGLQEHERYEKVRGEARQSLLETIREVARSDADPAELKDRRQSMQIRDELLLWFRDQQGDESARLVKRVSSASGDELQTAGRELGAIIARAREDASRVAEQREGDAKHRQPNLSEAAVAFDEAQALLLQLASRRRRAGDGGAALEHLETALVLGDARSASGQQLEELYRALAIERTAQRELLALLAEAEAGAGSSSADALVERRRGTRILHRRLQRVARTELAERLPGLDDCRRQEALQPAFSAADFGASSRAAQRDAIAVMKSLRARLESTDLSRELRALAYRRAGPNANDLRRDAVLTALGWEQLAALLVLHEYRRAYGVLPRRLESGAPGSEYFRVKRGTGALRLEPRPESWPEGVIVDGSWAVTITKS